MTLLVVFAGLPGSGKSTLAREIARREQAAWLRVDTIEAAMLRSGLARSFETGLAAYVAAQSVAEDQLRLGRTVVIDAVNGVEPAREMWHDLADKTHADLLFIEVVCSDPAEHRRRVETREPPTPPLPQPTWAEVLEREYLPWREPLLTVDSTAPVEVSVSRILAHLASRGREPNRGRAKSRGS